MTRLKLLLGGAIAAGSILGLAIGSWLIGMPLAYVLERWTSNIKAPCGCPYFPRLVNHASPCGMAPRAEPRPMMVH